MKCPETRLVELMRGTLPPAEVKALLSHLQECRICRERATVMAILAEIAMPREPRRSTRRRYLVAAGVCLLVLIPAILKFGFDTGPPHNLQADLAETESYPYFPIDPRSDEVVPSSRQKAFSAYQAKDFRTALEWLNRLEPDAEILFYRGVCEYLLGDYEASLWHLKRSGELEPRWKAPSLWYQASLHLQSSQIEKAEATLKQLTQLDEEYSERASLLLERLIDQTQGGSPQ